MKIVAKTMAGTAYRILMSLSINQPPTQPCEPKIKTTLNLQSQVKLRMAYQ
jgi:hypothetical protein